MSTASKDISYDVIDAIYATVATVTVGSHKGFTCSGTNYPVYKTIPKNPTSVYVKIGDVIANEEGTKDDFVWRGSIPVHYVDESGIGQADKKLAQSLRGTVREILKPTKASVPSGFIIFSQGGESESVEMSDTNNGMVRLTDIYEFLIE